jgi:hypothetical protein
VFAELVTFEVTLEVFEQSNDDASPSISVTLRPSTPAKSAKIGEQTELYVSNSLTSVFQVQIRMFFDTAWHLDQYLTTNLLNILLQNLLIQHYFVNVIT